jgi:cell division protein FtsQ
MRAAAAAVALRRPLTALVPPPHLRGRVLAVIGGLALLLCLYMVWFRDSSFVRVQQVSISGLTSSDSAKLREQLTATARTVTTLHVRQDKLDRVADAYPSVERLEVSADFPHTLRIDVIELQQAAILVSGRSRMPVAGDGRLLRGVRPKGPLPVIKLKGAFPSERLPAGFPLRAARVAGAAPLRLRRRIVDVSETRDRGLVAHLRNGPDLIFGDATRPRAKWLAAARVLADKHSRGASYVDLRLPERPAAGGLTVEPEAPSPTAEPSHAAPTATAPAAPTTTAPAAPANP